MSDLKPLDVLTPVPKPAEPPPPDGRRPVDGAAHGFIPRHAVAAAGKPGEGSRKKPDEAPPEAAPAQGGYPAGYPSGYGAPPTGGETHLLDYVRILYRRRWLAATAFVLVLVLVIVYTFTRTPIYQARTQIQIDYVDPNVVPFQQVTQQQVSWDPTEYFQTEYKILQSRSLAKRTLDTANLWTHPFFAVGNVGRDFPASAKNGGSAAASGEGGSPAVKAGPSGKDVVQGSSSLAAPDGSAGDQRSAQGFSPVQQESAIDTLLSGLTISPVRNSRLVDIRYASPDPQLAATVANALAKSYIEQNLAKRFQSSKDASEFLDKQLAEQRQQVEASELELQRYREKTDSVSLEDKQNITVQRLAELNAAVTRAKTERLQKEAVYNQVRAIQRDRAALDTFPAILSNTFIQQLKGQLSDLQRQRASLGEKYGDKHPEMIKLRTQIEQTDAKLQGEIAKVVQAIQNEYEAAQTQERSLVSALEQQKGETQALSRKGIDYGVLQRNATTNRQMFDALLQRAKETQVGSELKSSNIRIVDAATVPRGPISPNKPRNLLLGIFGGSIFAMGLAFFFEYLDNRIKSPEEIKHVLGLPFLGLVPVLKGDQQPENALLHSGVPTGFAEAFRTIRTNVLFSFAEGGGRSVVVTSTGPGEGKTLVTTNLAVALAQAGQRVLLVDADMRKPRVHQVFDMKVQPGLSNVLVSNAKASEAVRKGPVQNLYVLVAGVTPPNPAELLASQRFKDFLYTLQEHFDWVIVDAPPVMAVTDAAVVAHIAHGVIFVVGCEQTNKHMANAALEQLEAAKAKFLGGILNKVDVDRNSYYYSHYYRKSYASYYRADN